MPNKFHTVLYLCIARLVNEGCQEISEVEVENVASTKQIFLETLQDSNYFEFIGTMKELAIVGNYEAYYNTVRKFALLRELQDNGIDTNEFYNELEDEDIRRKFDTLTIQDILNQVEMKGTKLRGKYDVKYVRDETDAAAHAKELIDSFKERPAFGALLQSGYLSTIWNGWSRGHLILRAGASSSGKSRCSVADLCNVGVKMLWDDEAQDFVPNLNYQTPTLFIATEQDLETEVKPMFWAAVSGVEYRAITQGRMTPEEEVRVLKAVNVIEDSHITLTSMPTFTSKSLERKIKEKVENDGVGYMCFDYMEAQASLSAEFKTLNAMPPRQDLVLLSLTTDLKRYAEDYDVGILTGMQLNDGWKEARLIDESFLSGSKAAKNKIDNGSIIVPTSYMKRDIKAIQPLLAGRKGFGKNRTPMPNICENIFKGRYSMYGDRRLRLWSYFDRGTFRRYDYFVTDEDNIPQSDIKPSTLKEESNA